jgi:hypothetical protein
VLPEEIELARLDAEQAELEEQVALAELTLATTKNETAQFQQRYYQAVGRLYAQLDELAAQIANIRMERNPYDSVLKARALSAQQQARKSSEEAGLTDKQPKPTPIIDPSLKQAYRQAARLMHPDLAISAHERQRRTKLMVSLNLAYERGDLTEIARLVAEFGQDPEAIVGEDVASRIVKAIRRIAQLRRRLGELQIEMDANQKTEGFRLRQTVETAEAIGADPLGDLAQQLTKEISERMVELKAARQAGR